MYEGLDILESLLMSCVVVNSLGNVVGHPYFQGAAQFTCTKGAGTRQKLLAGLELMCDNVWYTTQRRYASHYPDCGSPTCQHILLTPIIDATETPIDE
jgi:hypothetical protein